MNDYIDQLLQKSKVIKERYDELKELTTASEIIAHNSYWLRLVNEQKSIEDIAFFHERLAYALKEKEICLNLKSNTQYDKLIDEEISALDIQIKELAKELRQLIAKESEDQTAIIELIPDTKKSEKFSQELISIYKNFFELEGYTFEEERVFTKSGTLKKVELKVFGKGAYSLLKGESGIHKAPSPLNAACKVIVMPQRLNVDIDISPSDIKTDIFHSSGAGGQHINKVETAVRLTHIPTGITAVCQDTRSQHKNREKAFENLTKKVKLHYQKISQEKYDRQKKALMKENTIIRIYDYLRNKAIDQKTNLEKNLDEVKAGDIRIFIENI
ncbi:MAG: peptide chain release factor-like protein [Clostridia bacterium]|nr:PCRF domain-containing protein [Clostridiales bacterium]